MTGAVEIEIALINGGKLDDGREIVGIRKHEVGEALVLIKITRQHDEAGTELARPGGRHGCVDAELARLITRRGDDAPPLTANRDGAASKLGVGGLLHGGKECVRIEVQNHDASPF